MKQAGSYLVAAVFRSYSVIIIVLILIFFFLDYVEGVEKDVEKIAAGRALNEINGLLAVTLYQYVIQGRLDELVTLDQGNPFLIPYIREKTMIRYLGVKKNITDEVIKAWYFDSDMQKVVYHSRNYSRAYTLKFVYKDNNANFRFDREVDGLEGFLLE